MSQIYSVTPLLAGRLAISAIPPLFVDRFGRSLWFCYLEFDKEAIFDGPCDLVNFEHILKINLSPIIKSNATLRRIP